MNAMRERRKNDRLSINHPIFYTGKNSNGKVEEQGVGLALDISVDGMMFESNEPIDVTDVSVSAAISKGNTVYVEGMLVYSMPYADGKYRSAIRFTGDPDQVTAFFDQMGNTSG